MKQLIISMICVVCVSILNAAPPAKQPTMAVLPFQISKVTHTENIGNLQITQNLVEHEFTNELINFLTKSRKFRLLTRTQIEQVMDENHLTDSEWSKPGQIQKMGKLLVADYLVTGTINRMDLKVIPQNIKITGETKPRVVATFKCQYQVIETSTGKILFAGQMTKKMNSEDIRREIPARIRRDWTPADYKDLLFAESAKEVGSSILESVYPVKIVEVSDGKVILNRGKGAGISVGTKYRVVHPGKLLIDPDTGENLGGTETEIGEIEITSIDVKFSTGKILSEQSKFQRGDICRIQLKKSEKVEDVEYPKADSGW